MNALKWAVTLLMPRVAAVSESGAYMRPHCAGAACFADDQSVDLLQRSSRQHIGHQQPTLVEPSRSSTEDDVTKWATEEVARRLAIANSEAERNAQKAYQQMEADRRNPVMQLELDDIVRASSNAELELAFPPNESPPNVSRESTFYQWCGCGSGLRNVTVWPGTDKSQKVTVDINSVRWVRFRYKSFAHLFRYITVSCDGMTFRTWAPHGLVARPWLPWKSKTAWVSLQLGTETKTGLSSMFCGKETGRLHWNTWSETKYISSVPFTTHTEGYFCFKIPAMLRTNTGALLALSEARRPDCSDFAETHMVFKRSVDGGATWGKLELLVQPEGLAGLCGHAVVIGNVAPVQLSADASVHPGRILMPFTVNNFDVYLTYSDDDGKTWSKGKQIQNVTNTGVKPDCDRGMSYFGYDIDYLNISNTADFVKWAMYTCYNFRDPYKNPKWKSTLTGDWQWVGMGPPGGIQLKNKRVLIPGYHSYIRGLEGTPGGDTVLPVSQLYNNFALGHVMISDDDGDTWRLGWEGTPIGHGINENQMVQLENGSVLTNARSLSTGSPQWRLQARSDDDGETFTASSFVYNQQEPFNGCQGSTTKGSKNDVYVASPNPKPARSVLQEVANMINCNINATGRKRVSVWKSSDGGTSYPQIQTIDTGLSAQTSLQYHEGDKLQLLYEQADPAPTDLKTLLQNILVQNMVVLLPERFIYREVLDEDFQPYT